MDLINGWTKSFARGALGTKGIVLFGIVGWLTGCLGTARHLVIACVGGEDLKMLILVGFYLLYAAQMFFMLRLIGQFSIATSLFYPVHVLFFVFVFVRSLFLMVFKKSVNWKGRTFSQ